MTIKEYGYCCGTMKQLIEWGQVIKEPDIGYFLQFPTTNDGGLGSDPTKFASSVPIKYCPWCRSELLP